MREHFLRACAVIQCCFFTTVRMVVARLRNGKTYTCDTDVIDDEDAQLKKEFYEVDPYVDMRLL